MATTIPHLKQQFLTGQLRILNAPLDPPDEWRDTAPASKSQTLSNKVVDDVLLKANRILRLHNANCFPPMVLEHVAAQIDALYWSQTTTAEVLKGEEREDAVALDADLREESTISSLPQTLPDEGGTITASPTSQSLSRRSVLESDDLATRYTRLRRSLQRLSEQRKETEQRLAQAKGMLELLAPLRDADRHVQQNLVAGSEEGELVAELRRMRELLKQIGQGD